VIIQLRVFTQEVMINSMETASVHLLRLIDKLSFPKVINARISISFPASIIPKNLNNLKFTSIDPLEIARHLTVLDSKLFNQLEPSEFLDKQWSTADAGNIKQVVQHANRITAWTSHTILKESDLKKRAKVLAHFILVAEVLKY
jgi:son of sevenless